MKKLLEQIFKFGIVGVLATVIDYGVMVALTELAFCPYLISNCISFSVAVIFNYICSILWVFDVDKKQDKFKNFVIFMVLSILGLGINQVLMWLCVEKLNIYYMIAKIIAAAFVMVFNFVTRKMFLEKR